MSTNTLLAAIVGFLLGGFVVSVAAQLEDDDTAGTGSEMTMSQMSEELADLDGSDFDEAFTASMIEHHRGALEMARLAPSRAEHDELERLAATIVHAQQEEIAQMERWRQRWDYPS